jgi:hypothetical protein
VIETNTKPEQGFPPAEEKSAGMADERMELLQRVLASRTFAKSVRLTRFLEFICLRTIEGNARELNEHEIGIHVFARSPAYSASDDSIVRTQARLLRQRLEEYFEHECPTCPMVISIPKGGYVPVFEPRNTVAKAPVYAPVVPVLAEESQVAAIVRENADKASPDIRSRRRGIYSTLAVGVAGVLLGLALSYLWSTSRNQGPADALWSSIFSRGRSVVIVPSDDALVLFEELTQNSVPLDEYLSGSYLTKSNLPHAGTAPLTSDWFAQHQYTSSADLNLAMRLGQLPEAVNGKVSTRNARVLRIDDLKSNNVILIGGIASNPWVGLFSSRLSFDVNYDWKSSEGYVLNKHPMAGEAAVYHDAISSDGTRRSYGVLVFLPGIEDNGQALLFEGTGMAGTEAAADFPFNPTSFRSFAQQIGAISGKMPYFEALIETTSIAGNAPEARLIAYRLIKA